MNDNLIDSIESMCNESEQNATMILAKIKAAIQNSKRPDFSKIKDGEHFIYRGIEFIRLGLEQGGVLCMTANIVAETAFDKDCCNDWRKSSARKMLNNEFASKLNPDDLLPYESDLTADNGDTAYGKCRDVVGLLSCDLYRKYRKFIPLFNEWMWTCTPWYCSTPYSGGAGIVRLVYTDGTLSGYAASSPIGLAPACIFHL